MILNTILSKMKGCLRIATFVFAMLFVIESTPGIMGNKFMPDFAWHSDFDNAGQDDHQEKNNKDFKFTETRGNSLVSMVETVAIKAHSIFYIFPVEVHLELFTPPPEMA